MVRESVRGMGDLLLRLPHLEQSQQGLGGAEAAVEKEDAKK